MAKNWISSYFGPFFPPLCLLMGDTLIPPSLLLTKMLPLGALSMRSMERVLFQAITTQFSHHLLENSIFSHFSPFVPAHGQPLDPTSLTSAFYDKTIIIGSCCNDIYGERATLGYYHSIFPPSS